MGAAAFPLGAPGSSPARSGTLPGWSPALPGEKRALDQRSNDALRMNRRGSMMR
jgi:hypothetical protein